jgi:hypothetical protein
LDPDKECDFYKWAWQNFLYATRGEADGQQPRFLSYKEPDEVFKLALAPFPSKLRESAGQREMLQLAPRFAKEPDPIPPAKVNGPESRSIPDVLQARSGGILVDQAGNAVYYGIHLNNVYADYITSKDFTDAAKLAAASDAETFPKGTMAFKSSWRIVNPGEDTSKYFVTRAVVPRLKDVPGTGIRVDPTQPPRQVMVALVGLHVAGVPEGHPEFVWATFEHVDNAPDLPAGVDHQAATPVDGSRNWTLYAKGTLAKDCNRKLGPSSSPRLTLDPATQLLKPPTQVFREFAFGGEPTPEQEIEPLNNSVHAQLPPNLNVWKNYKLIGAVWLNNPSTDFQANVDFGELSKAQPNLLGGETKLSNSSMETFTQDDKQSCFYCHRTVEEKMAGKTPFPPKRLSVNHVLTNAYFKMQRQSQPPPP